MRCAELEVKPEAQGISIKRQAKNPGIDYVSGIQFKDGIVETKADYSNRNDLYCLNAGISSGEPRADGEALVKGIVGYSPSLSPEAAPAFGSAANFAK
jgi:hypothetical protein